MFPSNLQYPSNEMFMLQVSSGRNPLELLHVKVGLLELYTSL